MEIRWKQTIFWKQEEKRWKVEINWRKALFWIRTVKIGSGDYRNKLVTDKTVWRGIADIF